MDAPTEWTYGGLLDWTSAESLRFTPTELTLRCIVEALKERAQAASYTLPSILTEDWSSLQSAYSIISAIQTSVTALIIRFCNHTDSSGDWSGIEDGNYVAPPWTESNILTEIESESRLSLIQLNPILASWIYQQYRILNLLKWKKNSSRLVGIGSYHKRGDGPGGEAVSEYNANDWLYNSTSNIMSAVYAVGWFNDPESEYNHQSDTVQRWKSQYRHLQSGVLFNSYDIYVRSKKFTGFFTEDTFNAQGSSVIEDVYSKIATTSEFSETTEFYVPDIDSAPPNSPPWIYPETPYNKSYGWESTSVLSVAKFDGANGFKFRDW